MEHNIQGGGFDISCQVSTPHVSHLMVFWVFILCNMIGLL